MTYRRRYRSEAAAVLPFRYEPAPDTALLAPMLEYAAIAAAFFGGCAVWLWLDGWWVVLGYALISGAIGQAVDLAQRIVERVHIEREMHGAALNVRLPQPEPEGEGTDTLDPHGIGRRESCRLLEAAASTHKDSWGATVIPGWRTLHWTQRRREWALSAIKDHVIIMPNRATLLRDGLTVRQLYDQIQSGAISPRSPSDGAVPVP